MRLFFCLDICQLFSGAYIDTRASKTQVEWMNRVSHGTGHSARKRRKTEFSILMCYDLTDNLSEHKEKNSPNKYELADVKDSCSIKYNGEQIQFNVRQLKYKLTLGEGNFGFVTLDYLEDRPDITFACKRMALRDTGNDHYSAFTDLKTMRAVGDDRHPHIVHFYAALLDLRQSQLVICMEVLERSIDKFYPVLHSLHPSDAQLDSLVRRLAKHMVLALDYLKSKNIIHRDVKPHNMLIDRQAIFKLCDFGICGTLKDSLASTYTGSERYLPPERFGNDNPYGARSDMWALGMSLLEVSGGSFPLPTESIMLFMIQIKNGWQPILPLTLTEDTRELLFKLLRHDVNERPRTYSNILEMSSMVGVTENPSDDELSLVHIVLDALPPHTSE